MSNKSLDESSRFYQAVKSWDWDLIDEFINNGFDINASLITTGSQAGYTALHLASIEDNSDNVSRLLTNYNADVNAIADDGIQSIHLALFFRYLNVSELLLKAGANANADFGRDIHEKYIRDSVWTDDFGGKMTLLTFAILNKLSNKFIRLLTKCKANVAIKSTNNKTLFMYAVENEKFITINLIRSYSRKIPELTEACDNDGLDAMHYLITDKMFGDFRYDQIISLSKSKFDILLYLTYPRYDKYGQVTGHPDVLLLNRAAYRCCYYILPRMLSFYCSNPQSKPLYYATLPVEDPQKCIRLYKDCPQDEAMKDLEIKKKRMIEYIIENLIICRMLGEYVPITELLLMNQLIATDTNIRTFVDSYEETIQKYLKSKVICFGGKSITLYELSVKDNFNKRNLKELVRYDNLDEIINIINQFYVKDESFFSALRSDEYLHHSCLVHRVLYHKIKGAYNRRIILEKIEKIEHLRKYIPLPYEIILDIIEYLNNIELEKFIDAFFCDSL